MFSLKNVSVQRTFILMIGDRIQGVAKSEEELRPIAREVWRRYGVARPQSPGKVFVVETTIPFLKGIEWVETTPPKFVCDIDLGSD